jgi:hypothetical protein
MKYIVIICMLMIKDRTYGQDSINQPSLKSFMKQFSVNSVRVNSYKQLPDFIRNYFDQVNTGKPYYISRSENDYLIIYEHVESGSHFHANVLKTNSKEILDVYNFIISEHRKEQDILVLSKIQAIAREFAENSFPIDSYEKLPECILNYLNQKGGGKFSLSRHRFNATDAGSGPKRKLTYIAQLGDDYILAYEHGGIGYHFHSVIFETNGKEVVSVYSLVGGIKHDSITELIKQIEVGNIWIQTSDEF